MRKLEPLGEKGVLVGYNEASKAYRVFMSAQQKTLVSWDFKFEENLGSKKSHELPPVAKDQE